MIVSDPAIASYVSANGVDRLFVDLERNGKQARQGHVNSWKSIQTIEDVSLIREAAPDAQLLVRINPIHADSAQEIDAVIARGANCVMLPMFSTREELATFYDLLNDRAIAVPLFETAASLRLLSGEIDDLPLAEAHIGMNDLHLDLGSRFMFEPLADGVLEDPCEKLRARGVTFGIGGIARAHEGIVSPEHLLGEHVRLGSTGAILSRTFHRNSQTLDELLEQADFPAELAKLRAIYASFQQMSTEELLENSKLTADRIADVARLVELRANQ